jgi:hypothetical protein
VSEEPHSGSGGGGGPKGSSKPKVVPLPQRREVSEKHLANLRASGLTDDTIKLAELYSENNHRALATIVQRKTWASLRGSALVIPFYLPGGSEPHAYRVRPSNPQTEHRGRKVRQRKYDQAEEHGVLVYFTPRARAARWYTDAPRTLFWTEGEKKSLVLDQLGLACVGLTGVWNWGDKKHRDATGEERLHPTIRDHAIVAGRHHIICFDGDARDNEQVMLAAARLCGVLRAAGAVSVRFVCPPSLEQKGIDDYFVAHGGEVTLALLQSAVDLEPADPKSPLQRVTKLKVMRDAPLSATLLMPEGYSIERDVSLWRAALDEKHGDVRVAPVPVFIVRELSDHYTGERRLELAYPREESWQTLCVSRKATIDSRTMVAELAPYGAPVTSNSAPKLVDWFEAFATANAASIPCVACVSSSGWHTIDGRRSFVTNEAVASEADHVTTIALDTRGDRRKMFESLAPRGDIGRHTAALRRAWDADPICAAMIAGALAATLLEPLGAPNFAIHLPGESSRGKTSMLKIAASVFGDPNDQHWVASWNVTQTGAEMRAASLCDLPQCYDEVGGGGDAQAAERLVYALINGGGRTRAQRDLTMRETQSWRTVVLSTGERELADESTATGAQVRVLHLPVDGFGMLDAAAIDALREECAANAGRFGRAWLEELLAIDDWAPYRAALKQFTATMREATHDPLQGRVAAYFALLAFAESLAANLGIGDAKGGTMRRLFTLFARREEVRGVAERVRDLVNDWVLSEPDAFPELGMSTAGDDDEPRPSRGNGKVRHGFRKNGEVYIIPAEFRAFCGRHRLSSRTVIREWLALGWTDVETNRLDKRVRLGAHSTPRFVILLPTTSADPGSP